MSPSQTKKMTPEIEAEYKRLKEMVAKFNKRGLFDTCHHTDLARLEREFSLKEEMEDGK